MYTLVSRDLTLLRRDTKDTRRAVDTDQPIQGTGAPSDTRIHQNDRKPEPYYIVQTTVYPTSLHETVRRQNLTGGLTNITDRCFEFFCSGVMNYDPAAVREGALETAYNLYDSGQRSPTDYLRNAPSEAVSIGDTRQGRVMPELPE